MKLPDLPTLFVMAAIFLLVCALGVAACDLLNAPGRAKQAKAGQVIAEGQLAAGRDAVAITTAAGAREAQADNITRSNADEIRKAPGADAPIDPALAAAGRRGLCKRKAYRDRPECVF